MSSIPTPSVTQYLVLDKFIFIQGFPEMNGNINTADS